MKQHVNALAPDAPDFDYQSYPFYLLSRASGRYNEAMETALKPIGLDQARWRILLVLAQHDWLGTQEIARKVVYKLSTTTRMVQRLERDTLVKTEQSEADGRIRNVAITSGGLAVVNRSRPLAAAVFKEAFAEVSADDLAAFCRVLGTIDIALRAK